MSTLSTTFPTELPTPSSRFPFSPLTDLTAYAREDSAAGRIALSVAGGSWDNYSPGMRAELVQGFVELLRSTDVRCGYDRPEWASL